MRIGILTQPLHNNYGGLLQAFALQTSLKRLGHDSLVLDRHSAKPSLPKYFIQIFKNFIFRYLRGNKNREIFPFYPSDKENEVISVNTSNFIQKYINRTEPLYSTQDLSRKTKYEQFDAFISGSDQVWRPYYSNVENCFFDFLDGKYDIKRISYAASFGVDHWEYTPRLTRKCVKLVKRFTSISVREDSGVDLCKKYLGVDAMHVLDPTLLLEPEDYKQMVFENNEPQSPGSLMSYILDSSEDKDRIVKNLAEQLGLVPFSVMQKRRLTRENRERIEECVFPPVTQWLRGYMDAEFVVVDSFHGCAFAILFNVPFIVIGNQFRGMARFNSILTQFGLIDRLIYSSNQITNELIHKPIDWQSINKIRTYLKHDSIKFLKESLE